MNCSARQWNVKYFARFSKPVFCGPLDHLFRCSATSRCRYTPQTIELETKLKPFIPDFIPAVGDIDAFLKVTHHSASSQYYPHCTAVKTYFLLVRRLHFVWSAHQLIPQVILYFMYTRTHYYYTKCVKLTQYVIQTFWNLLWTGYFIVA